MFLATKSEDTDIIPALGETEFMFVTADDHNSPVLIGPTRNLLTITKASQEMYDEFTQKNGVLK
jgi:hypothetical protein